MKAKVLNFAAFQLAWFANVLGAAAGLPWLGPVVLVAWMTAHLGAMRDERAAEVRVLIFAASFGYLADSLLTLSGYIGFDVHTQFGGPSPLWMVALWVGFAATFSRSLSWLQGRYTVGAALGAVGGPLAYLAGEELGAISLAPGAETLALVAVEWAVATPLLLRVHAMAASRAATPAAPCVGGGQPS